MSTPLTDEQKRLFRQAENNDWANRWMRANKGVVWKVSIDSYGTTYQGGVRYSTTPYQAVLMAIASQWLDFVLGRAVEFNFYGPLVGHLGSTEGNL